MPKDRDAVSTKPQGEQRYFARCEMESGEELTLVARAHSPKEANEKLHDTYLQLAVIHDIATSEEALKARRESGVKPIK